MKCLICKNSGIFSKIKKLIQLWLRVLLAAIRQRRKAYVVLVISYLAQSCISYLSIILFERFVTYFSLHTSDARVWILFFEWSLCTLCGLVIDGVNVYLINTFVKALNQYFERKYAEKAARFPPLFFESEDFRLYVDKAKIGAQRCATVVVLLTSILAYYVPYFLFVSWYLAKVCSWFSIALLLMLFPFIISGIIRKETVERNINEAASLQRKYKYFYSCNAELEYTAETRAYSSQSFFFNRFLTYLSDYSKLSKKIEQNIRQIELILRSISSIVLAAFIVSLVITTLRGEMAIGRLAVTLSVLLRLYGILEDLLRYDGQALMDNAGVVSIYYSFLDQSHNEPSKLVDGHFPIHFDHVSFRYQTSAPEIIKDINLTIEPFSTIVIVGENGAGKTTFASLLAGLYKPTKGEIYNSGDPAKMLFNPQISVLCQKFIHYKLSMYENIIISDLERANNSTLHTREYVNHLVKKYGLADVLDAHKANIYINLSREFGGIDLSGGEWQNVAIARAAFRNGSLLILDEPNSSLDPNQENDLYDKLRELAEKQTTIIISHRLGIAKIADRVILIENGEIVEDGTFDELLKAEGRFFEMYNRQAAGYKE